MSYWRHTMEICNYLPQRFEKLSQEMNNAEAVILFSNPDAEGVNRFEQDKNFLYLTGLEIPNARLIIIKTKDKLTSTLFIARNIPERVVWEGAKMYPEEATEISTIKNVKFLDEFETVAVSTLAMNSIKKVYVNYASLTLDQPLSERHLFVEKLKQRQPNLLF